MTADELKPKSWYWIRRPDGTLAPYVFHRISRDPQGQTVAEFFVGSFLVTFQLSQIEAEAQMPSKHDTQAKS